MKHSLRLVFALLIGVALAVSIELLYGCLAAVPMPWLLDFGKHTARGILLLLDLCAGMVPAYLVGRVIFRRVSHLLPAAILIGLPWVIVCTYYDYETIRELQLHPAFPSALQATLHSRSFLPAMLISMLSLPLGLGLALRKGPRIDRSAIISG